MHGREITVESEHHISLGVKLARMAAIQGYLETFKGGLHPLWSLDLHSGCKTTFAIVADCV